MKFDRHAPYGKLQAIDPFEKPWQGIIFDLIIKLLTSRELIIQIDYDAI